MVKAKSMLLCLLLAGAAGAAIGQDLVELLLADLEIEHKLLDKDLQAYSQARSREARQMARVQELAERLDDQLGREDVAIAELEMLEQALTAAREAASAASRRALEVHQRIIDRFRRIDLLQVELGRQRAGELAIPDPVSGSWEVLVLPMAQRGVFHLRLDGTLVSGSYQLEGGFRGSLRGTYVGEILELERIDSERGHDLLLKGQVRPERGEIRGSWQATLLNSGGPSGGDWMGTKLSREENRE